jgi:hypothetical protein
LISLVAAFHTYLEIPLQWSQLDLI